MTRTILILFAALILLQVPCGVQAGVAQDFNAMTTEELQAMVAQQQALLSVQQQQIDQKLNTVIITVDDEFRQAITLLKSEMASLKESNQRMEDRFNRLVEDTAENIEASEQRTIVAVTAKVQGALNEGLSQTLDRIQELTNPVRIGLPIIGTLLMFTGCFLLWAARQYKLTGGRKPAQVKQVIKEPEPKPDPKEEARKQELENSNKRLIELKKAAIIISAEQKKLDAEIKKYSGVN